MPRSQHPKTQVPNIEYGSKRGVSDFGLAIYIKNYFKAKEGLMEKTQIYFTMQKNIILKKNPLKKKTKFLEDIITLELISSLNTIQKTPSFKNPQVKLDLLLLLPRGQNPLSYHTLY